MPRSVFRGYNIKEIDMTRTPKEHLREKDLQKSYTVYVLLEPFYQNIHGREGLPNINSHLQKYWGDYFNQHSSDWVAFACKRFAKSGFLPYSQIEYCENGDCGEIRIHKTSLEKIRLLDREGKNYQLKTAVEGVNSVMKYEINRTLQ